MSSPTPACPPPTPGLETPSTLVNGLRECMRVQGSGPLSSSGAVHPGLEAYVPHGFLTLVATASTVLVAGWGMGS